MNIPEKSPKDFTILVVDDEDLLREAVCFDFKRRGYSVLSAACGNEALSILSTNAVDVVISDVRMPNGNGLELLKAIKKINVFTPVVMFITGFADITLEEAYDMGADAVFPKPFDRKALQEAVERAVQPAEARFNRKAVRVDVRLPSSITTKNETTLSPSEVLNVGRGGFFAAVKGELPALGEIVHFVIYLEQEDKVKVSGSGVVRWTRRAGAGPKHPPGCGIEFVQLDEECRKKFLEQINLIKTKAFIPMK